MKTFIMSLLAMMMTLVANAQQPTARFTITIGDTSDRSCIPIEINLENSDEIMGIGGYIFHPFGSRFIDPENPESEVAACTKNEERCEEVHQIDLCEETSKKGFFFAFFSKDLTPLKGNSGRVLTLYLDCTNVPDGEYAMRHDIEAVGKGFSAIFPAKMQVAVLELGEEDPNLPKFSITTDANGTGTFVCEESNLNFRKSELKAYVATKVDNEYVYLQEVQRVPAGTGFMVKGKPNTTYEVRTTMADVTLPYRDIYFYQYPGNVMENDLVYGYSSEDGRFHRLDPQTETEWGKAYVAFQGALEWGYDMEQGMNVITNNTSGITAETLKPLFIIPGDVNADGKVSMADANMIVNKCLGGSPAGMIMEAADVNEDGTVTTADAKLIVDEFLGRE